MYIDFNKHINEYFHIEPINQHMNFLVPDDKIGEHKQIKKKVLIVWFNRNERKIERKKIKRLFETK